MKAVFGVGVLAVLASCVVAGCGGGGAFALDPVAAAAVKTEKVTALRTTMQMSMAVQGHQFSISGQGVMDTAANAAKLDFSFSGLPGALTKNGTQGEAIMEDTVMYMKMPFLQGQLPDGKSWMKIDFAKASPNDASSLDQGLGQTDPRQWLEQLLASGKATKVGTETLQGAQTTHYHVTVDTADLAHVPAAKRADVASQLKRLGLTALPLEVWVDNSGLVRRETMTLAMNQGGVRETMSLATTFAPLSATPTITPPPSGDVFDATQLAAKAAGQTTQTQTTTTTTSTTTPPDTGSTPTTTTTGND